MRWKINCPMLLISNANKSLDQRKDSHFSPPQCLAQVKAPVIILNNVSLFLPAVQPRERLLLPHLLTVLVPPPQTGPASPEGAPAEAPSMGSSSESGAVRLTMGRLPPRPMKLVPLHTPEGERPPG